MAEKRKTKQKKKDKRSTDDFKPTKEECAIGKFLRFNIPVKQTTVMGNEVNYFTGSKAVDMLLDSKWATGKAKVEPLFTTRDSCAHYLQTLLEKEFFYRARRLVQRPRDKEKEIAGGTALATKAITKAKETEKGEKKSPKILKESKSTAVEPSKELVKKEEEKPNEDKDKSLEDKENVNDASKKKKKIKLEMHPDQVFVDSTDVYVWVYDPTPLKTWLLGSVIVVGSILVCLFPLWPPEVRNGVYYLSMSAMVFVGVIVALIVLRSILFGLVWMTTMGRHHFWLLPNLTEDCGFFDSFKPTYSHKYYPKAGSDDSKDEKSDSIAIQDVKEDNNEENLKSEDNLESKTNEDGEDLSDKSDKTDTDRESDEERGDCKDDEPKTKRRGKDSRSSSSHESNNDFELVDTPAANNQ